MPPTGTRPLVAAIALAARVVCVGLLVLTTGCAGSTTPGPRASSTQPGTASPLSPDVSEPTCPNPHGGRCLGPLDAGAHTTSMFGPTLTYVVPDGWENQEDLPGNFLLLPPGAELAGVDAGTSDYIGVYTSVRASGGCDGQVGLGGGPRRVASTIRSDPDLRVSRVTAAEVGNLRGLVMDVVLAPSPSEQCPSFGGGPAVPLLVGSSATSIDHAMVEGLTMRLYLLAHAGGTLAIEVDDVHGGRHLDDYSSVVEEFRFAD